MCSSDLQEGSLGAVTAAPRSRYVAELVGVNFLAGTAHRGVFRADDGIELRTADTAVEGRSAARVHPHAVSLHTVRPDGTPRNVLAAVVAEVELLGDRARVTVEMPPRLTAEVTADAVRSLGLRPGVAVWASIKATEVEVYPV